VAADEHTSIAPAARGIVRFGLDGRTVEAAGIAPTTTVLEYLRDTLGRCGTKEGCAEGDCGACTIVLGELPEGAHRIRYTAVNSCIRFLPTIDGRELISVESLAGPDGALHPVQQAMVDHHASQCGFCTPGFVMSLFALYLNNAAPRRDEVVDALAGNLCRCTGYRPIIEAGCALSRYPLPARWSASDAQSAERVAHLRSLQHADMFATAGFCAPRTVNEVCKALEAAPDSLLLAGGTDIGLWTTKQLRELAPIVYLGEVRELKRIRRTTSSLEIGAAVSLADAWREITALYPTLVELVKRFASPPICNAGTLCGNIANGSPVGDSMPALIALGAEIELRCRNGARRLPLESFYLGYQRKDLRAGEFVECVRVPLSQPGQRVASYKVSKRFDQDIASVCAAFMLELERGRVRNIRIAFGGMAAVPARARNAEAAFLNGEWAHATLEAAIAGLDSDFEPLSDLRASARYRRAAAGNLLRRFYLETIGGGQPLRLADVALTREAG
jgi:xanthine dehydrogenase small subunit